MGTRRGIAKQTTNHSGTGGTGEQRSQRKRKRTRKGTQRNPKSAGGTKKPLSTRRKRKAETYTEGDTEKPQVRRGHRETPEYKTQICQLRDHRQQGDRPSGKQGQPCQEIPNPRHTSGKESQLTRTKQARSAPAYGHQGPAGRKEATLTTSEHRTAVRNDRTTRRRGRKALTCST